MAVRFENLWQYSKVYPEHMGPERTERSLEIEPAWYEWRAQGFASMKANRYPMGKGRRPLFSLWGDQRMLYVEARKKIYVPTYAQLVTRTPMYRLLKKLRDEGSKLILFDYDAYDYVEEGLTFEEALDNPHRRLGHAMVLCALLKGELPEPAS
jgi:hypothetical protein